MSPTQNRPQIRWWTPLLLVLAPAVTGLVLWYREAPFLEPILLGLGLLAGLMLGAWLILCTGLPKRTRWILLSISGVLLIASGLAVASLTRVEGSIGGSGIPRLVWKWSPVRETAAEPLVVASQDGSTNAIIANEQSGFHFPQFLGPDRSGSTTNTPLDVDWAARPPQLVWKQPIGLGWSAFAVSRHRAITQEQRLGNELIVCYELQTGKPLWAHTNQARFSEALGGDGPRATPTIHDGRVYAMGGSGILNCLDEATGRSLWSRDVLRENNLSNVTWGKSCSPLIVSNLVVVTGGEEREKTLLAYEARTGAPLWQAGKDRASYASPMLGRLSGHQQIIMVNAHSVTGHDPLEGDILWEYPWRGDYAKVTQPVVIDANRVFVAAGYGIGCVMLKVERKEPGGWSVTELWKNRNLKPKFTNVVRKGDYVYGLDEGILTCVNLNDGRRVWKEGRYGHGQILEVGDLLLVQAERGDVVLVRISPQKPTELSRFAALQGKTWNNPVLVHDLLLVRNDQQAACYRLPLMTSQEL